MNNKKYIKQVLGELQNLEEIWSQVDQAEYIVVMTMLKGEIERRIENALEIFNKED